MTLIAANDNLPHRQDYEACNTCTKDGKAIRELFTRPDYLCGEFQKASSALLDQLALPHPQKSQIFRGTQHDMLFQRQGLVTRIGPMNHANILHPAILQPLIHVNDNAIGEELTLTISTGIRFTNKPISSVKAFMSETKQNTKDVAQCNVGMTDDETVIMLDLDDMYSGTLCKKLRGLKKKRLDHHMRDGAPWHIAARQVMEDIYGDHINFDHYIRAYDYHQPLRTEIHEAVTSPNPDDRRQKLSDFYTRCASLVKAKNDAGLALYRPWTGKAIDNKLKRTKFGVSLA